ncbi:MAG: D-2-hydroxyacid dehydrogenase [Thermoanaerobaculia bacterium]|nr:D-2-hydroxyacid dehydrogenase [Thermoanaerobaculia bacterium]
MRLVVLAPEAFAPLARLRSEAQDVEIIVGDEIGALREAAESADAILATPHSASLLVDLWRDIRHVRWIHTLLAGVENLPYDLLRTSEVVVTNSRGLYADALGEFAIAAMLWFAKDLRRLAQNQSERRWEPFLVERLEGETAGIIGYGGIGQAVGRRAEALGMRVVSVRKRGEMHDPTVDDVIREARYIVLSTPLTPATYRLIDAKRIAAMRSDAVLINVSRGAVVDEAALIDALRTRKIRGAALDVFETEPLPHESPLWTLDNILISPHSADHTADAHDRAMDFFLENLRRFQRGEALENVVDKVERY